MRALEYRLKINGVLNVLIKTLIENFVVDVRYILQKAYQSSVVDLFSRKGLI